MSESRKFMKNETAIVTGGTSGIGKRISEYFLEAGCKVAICSRNEGRVNATVAELKAKYGEGNIFGFPCDVAVPASVRDFIQKSVEALGSIRICVANAGLIGMYGPFTMIPYDQLMPDMELVIGTILMGTISTVHAVLPIMMKQKYGRIITLSGGGADRPLTNMVVYSGAKGGVISFSRCLAMELSQLPNSADIKINTYSPGWIKTELNSRATTVPGWTGYQQQATDLAMQYIGADIHTSTRKVLPYALPSCKVTGKIFRGFSIRKMITGGRKLRKAMKHLHQSNTAMSSTRSPQAT